MDKAINLAKKWGGRCAYFLSPKYFGLIYLYWSHYALINLSLFCYFSFKDTRFDRTIDFCFNRGEEFFFVIGWTTVIIFILTIISSYIKKDKAYITAGIIHLALIAFLSWFIIAMIEGVAWAQR